MRYLQRCLGKARVERVLCQRQLARLLPQLRAQQRLASTHGLLMLLLVLLLLLLLLTAVH